MGYCCGVVGLTFFLLCALRPKLAGLPGQITGTLRRIESMYPLIPTRKAPERRAGSRQPSDRAKAVDGRVTVAEHPNAAVPATSARQSFMRSGFLGKIRALTRRSVGDVGWAGAPRSGRLGGRSVPARRYTRAARHLCGRLLMKRSMTHRPCGCAGSQFWRIRSDPRVPRAVVRPCCSRTPTQTELPRPVVGCRCWTYSTACSKSTREQGQ